MTITYNIEAHDITDLTWPMWDACGIECPAMIGADCPRKTGNTCSGWSARFDNAAAEVVHGWSMVSDQSDECGGGESGHPWYGLFKNPDAGTHDGPMGAGVILMVTGQGFVSTTRYGAPGELDEAWTTLLEETRECPYESDGCTSSELCEQCTADDDE